MFGGTKGYVQVVRDNYLRFILAYRVGRTISGAETRELLEEAVLKGQSFWYLTTPPPPIVISDSGSENMNQELKALDKESLIKVKNIKRFLISGTRVGKPGGQSVNFRDYETYTNGLSSINVKTRNLERNPFLN